MDPKAGFFPFHVPGGTDERGIIQRDFVAVAALQGMLSRPDIWHDDEKLVAAAFKIADAFVALASKRDEPRARYGTPTSPAAPAF